MSKNATPANGEALPAMNRRAAILGALTSTAALAFPAAAAIDMRTRAAMADLIAAHRAASAASKTTGERYCAALAGANLPPVRVTVGKHYRTEEPIFAHTEDELRQFSHSLASFNPVAAAKRLERQIAELQAARDANDAAYKAARLDVLGAEDDFAADAEFAAFEALIAARPASLQDVHAKAAYLLEYGRGDEFVRLGNWVEDILAGLLAAADDKAVQP